MARDKSWDRISPKLEWKKHGLEFDWPMKSASRGRKERKRLSEFTEAESRKFAEVVRKGEPIRARLAEERYQLEKSIRSKLPRARETVRSYPKGGLQRPHRGHIRGQDMTSIPFYSRGARAGVPSGSHAIINKPPVAEALGFRGTAKTKAPTRKPVSFMGVRGGKGRFRTFEEKTSVTKAKKIRSLRRINDPQRAWGEQSIDVRGELRTGYLGGKPTIDHLVREKLISTDFGHPDSEGGPHAAMVAAGIPERDITEGSLQVTPTKGHPGTEYERESAGKSRQRLIKEALQRYPSKGKNKRKLKSGIGFSTEGSTVVGVKELVKGRAFFGRAGATRAGRPNIEGGKTIPPIVEIMSKIDTDTRGLKAATKWVNGLVKTLGDSEYHVALVAEAFRPTYRKMLRYTPYAYHQPKKRTHILETARFDYGVQAKKGFIRISFGGPEAPHTRYAYFAPPSWRFEDEGRARWIEEAVHEDIDQIIDLITSYLAFSFFPKKGKTTIKSLDNNIRASLLFNKLQKDSVEHYRDVRARGPLKSTVAMQGATSRRTDIGKVRRRMSASITPADIAATPFPRQPSGTGLLADDY